MNIPRLAARFAVLALILSAGCRAADPESAWTPLFNGQDLEGWEHVGEGAMVVEDGVIKTEGGMGLLWYTGRKLENETLRVVYRTVGNGGSGVYIRIPERPTEPWMPVDRGYEVQIADSGDDYHVTGTLYSLTRARARPFESDAWNTMDITVDGDRTTVVINGEMVTDYTEGDPVPEKQKEWEPERGPRPEAGYVGLQNHGEDELVLFREVKVRPLR